MLGDNQVHIKYINKSKQCSISINCIVTKNICGEKWRLSYNEKAGDYIRESQMNTSSPEMDDYLYMCVGR